MACCDATYDLGCIDQCGTLTIGASTQTGNHTLRIDDGVRTLKEVIAFTAPADIELTNDGTRFSAGYSYVVRVENPDGSEYTRTISSVVYDCFQFSVTKTVTIE